MNDLEWVYLGDGLYATWDGWQIVLRANDPRSEYSPTVYLDRSVTIALQDFTAKHYEF